MVDAPASAHVSIVTPGVVVNDDRDLGIMPGQFGRPGLIAEFVADLRQWCIGSGERRQQRFHQGRGQVNRIGPGLG